MEQGSEPAPSPSARQAAGPSQQEQWQPPAVQATAGSAVLPSAIRGNGRAESSQSLPETDWHDPSRRATGVLMDTTELARTPWGTGPSEQLGQLEGPLSPGWRPPCRKEVPPEQARERCICHLPPLDTPSGPLQEHCQEGLHTLHAQGLRAQTQVPTETPALPKGRSYCRRLRPCSLTDPKSQSALSEDRQEVGRSVCPLEGWRGEPARRERRLGQLLTSEPA